LDQAVWGDQLSRSAARHKWDPALHGRSMGCLRKRYYGSQCRKWSLTVICLMGLQVPLLETAQG
jgi:hypothetical protein